MPAFNEMALAQLRNKIRTPDDLARVHMSAEGDYYLPDAPNMAMQASGMGHLEIPQRAPMARAGSRAYGQQIGNLSKYGVEMGPYWSDVADLNRGRRATGAAREFDPLAGFGEAAQQGENIQAQINAQALRGLRGARG
jgi:hypothetical protein